MLVTVSGTHGVGKTTICRLFKQRNPGWEFVPEILDTTIKPPDDEKMRMLWFFNQYIERERFLVDIESNVIADRDWIDCLVYAKCSDDYEIIKRLYLGMKKTEPDLRIIVTLAEDQILQRVNLRDRDLKEKWKEDDIDFIQSVNNGFLEYYNDFKDLKPIVLLDGTLSPADACRRLEREISNIMEFSQRAVLPVIL